MTPQIGIVLFLLFGAVAVFAVELVSVDIVGLTIVAVLIVSGILTPDQAFSGFSNPAVIMIAGLLVISGGLYHSGVPDALGRSIYRYSGRNVNRLLIFIMSTEAAVSAFMNNVAATAMFLPGVTALAKNARISASKFLIPLAYASMLGGTCTLIGTSTNMAVNGLLRTYNVEPFGFFEYAPLGILIALCGVAFIVITHRLILPVPFNSEGESQEIPREYLTEAVILRNSPMAGRALEQSGLDKMDLMALGIVRHGVSIHSPSATERIEADDILLIQGKAPDILKIKKVQGLQIREDVRNREVPITNIVEVEIAPRSGFIGKTLKEMNFRQRYGLSVIAIYRQHERVISKIGDLYLRLGDVLLIQGPPMRIEQIKVDSNFLFLNELSFKPYDRKKGVLSISIFGMVVVLGGLGVFPISAVAFLGAILMVLSRTLSLKDAYGSLEWSLLILIAGMMSLGMAMESTGTAEYLARKIIALHEHPSPLFLMGAFFVLTVLLTQPLSNAAAALVVLPMAIHVAIAQGVNPRAYAMAVSIAASCSFLTPLEPACALVYNAGRYRLRDFLRAGIGLTLVVFILCMLVIPLLWPF